MVSVMITPGDLNQGTDSLASKGMNSRAAFLVILCWSGAMSAKAFVVEVADSYADAYAAYGTGHDYSDHF